VDAQDEVIANGGDPIADLEPLTATGLNPSIANDGDPITGLMKLDIKKK
jgi:hypothetical protein